MDIPAKDQSGAETREDLDVQQRVCHADAAAGDTDGELAVGSAVDVVVDAEGDAGALAQLPGQGQILPLGNGVAAQDDSLAVDDARGRCEPAHRFAVVRLQAPDHVQDMVTQLFQPLLTGTLDEGRDGGVDHLPRDGRSGDRCLVALDVQGDHEAVPGSERVAGGGPAGPGAGGALYHQPLGFQVGDDDAGRRAGDVGVFRELRQGGFAAGAQRVDETSGTLCSRQRVGILVHVKVLRRRVVTPYDTWFL